MTVIAGADQAIELLVFEPYIIYQSSLDISYKEERLLYSKSSV